MTRLHGSLFVSLLALMTSFAFVPMLRAESADGPVYELRIYTCEPGKLAALNERFKNHTMGIFARHGMENVAYWIPTAEPESANTLVYLLRHKSREAAKNSWDGFRNDPEWKRVATQWREKYGRVLAKGPDATYMISTDYGPQTSAADRDRLYELRIYTAAEGKLDALHNRFRQHTDTIFAKHGMQAIGYWTPLDEPKSRNVLIYTLQHKDRASAAAAWKAFGSDPDWQAARKASEVDGSLLAKRPERIYMKPTDYSPQK